MGSTNPIGKMLMTNEYVLLEEANMDCDMCQWLEKAYKRSVGLKEIEAYATEILLHRRSFHISPDSPN